MKVIIIIECIGPGHGFGSDISNGYSKASPPFLVVPAALPRMSKLHMACPISIALYYPPIKRFVFGYNYFKIPAWSRRVFLSVPVPLNGNIRSRVLATQSCAPVLIGTYRIIADAYQICLFKTDLQRLHIGSDIGMILSWDPPLS